MLDIPGDLGRRILEAARLAVQMHLDQAGGATERNDRILQTGGAGLGVRDDAPPASAFAPADHAEREAA